MSTDAQKDWEAMPVSQRDRLLGAEPDQIAAPEHDAADALLADAIEPQDAWEAMPMARRVRLLGGD